MEYLSIQNFKYGRDARRSMLASLPGVLEVCENAHINSGAEIEKRKAFFRSANAFPVETFGLEATSAGLVTFGSVAQGSLTGSLPLGVTYQRLVSPATYRPGTSTADEMIAVIASCNFNGKAFVLAQFYSGTFAFYDGTLVPSSRNGRVLQMNVGGTAETLSQLSADLAAQINALDGWIATANSGGTGRTEIKSPSGVYFEVVSSNTSTSGLIGSSLTDRDNPGTAAVAAVAAFKVVNGTEATDTFNLSAFKDVAGTQAIDIVASPVPCGASVGATASAIVSAINAYTTLTGYTAILATDSVWVYAPQSFGNVTWNLTIETTGTADVSADPPTAITTLAASASPTSSSRWVHAWRDHYQLYSDLITASAVGGTAPYVTYAWEECNADGSTPVTSASGISIEHADAAATKFYKILDPNTQVSGYFKCGITDSAGPPAATAYTSPVKITLKFIYGI